MAINCSKKLSTQISQIEEFIKEKQIVSAGAKNLLLEMLRYSTGINELNDNARKGNVANQKEMDSLNDKCNIYKTKCIDLSSKIKNLESRYKVIHRNFGVCHEEIKESYAYISNLHKGLKEEAEHLQGDTEENGALKKYIISNCKPLIKKINIHIKNFCEQSQGEIDLKVGSYCLKQTFDRSLSSTIALAQSNKEFDRGRDTETRLSFCKNQSKICGELSERVRVLEQHICSELENATNDNSINIQHVDNLHLYKEYHDVNYFILRHMFKSKNICTKMRGERRDCMMWSQSANDLDYSIRNNFIPIYTRIIKLGGRLVAFMKPDENIFAAHSEHIGCMLRCLPMGEPLIEEILASNRSTR